MEYIKINSVKLLRETLSITRSVYIPSIIIYSLYLLTVLASNLLSLMLNEPATSGILMGLAGIFLNPILSGANIFYFHGYFSRNYISIRKAFDLSIQKTSNLIFASFVIFLISFILGALLSLPGFCIMMLSLQMASNLIVVFLIVGIILFLLPAFYIGYRLFFNIHAITIENLSALDGITRSWQLTKGYCWSIFQASLLLAIILFFPVIVLPLILLSWGIPPQIANIVSGILGLLISPFFNVHSYLLYVNLKKD